MRATVELERQLIIHHDRSLRLFTVFPKKVLCNQSPIEAKMRRGKDHRSQKNFIHMSEPFGGENISNPLVRKCTEPWRGKILVGVISVTADSKF
jgi:hypothetical protein